MTVTGSSAYIIALSNSVKGDEIQAAMQIAAWSVFMEKEKREEMLDRKAARGYDNGRDALRMDLRKGCGYECLLWHIMTG